MWEGRGSAGSRSIRCTPTWIWALDAAPWAAIRLCVEHRYSVLAVTE